MNCTIELFVHVNGDSDIYWVVCDDSTVEFVQTV